MQEQISTTAHRPVTQSLIPWTDEELALIDNLARRSPSKADLHRYFPNRTTTACRKQLSNSRVRQGLTRKRSGHLRPAVMSNTILKPDDPGVWAPPWTPENVVESNCAYLAALARMAA